MRPCQPSSRHWRPLRRNVIYRVLADVRARRGNCAWIRLGASEAGSDLDRHVAVLLLLVDLGILDLRETAAREVAFTRRTDESACKQLKRLQDLIADHEAHGWPSDDVLHEEVQAILPTGMGAGA